MEMGQIPLISSQKLLLIHFSLRQRFETRSINRWVLLNCMERQTQRDIRCIQSTGNNRRVTETKNHCNRSITRHVSHLSAFPNWLLSCSEKWTMGGGEGGRMRSSSILRRCRSSRACMRCLHSHSYRSSRA